MVADARLEAHCAELLGVLGSVRARRMFGGTGFDVDGHFLAIVAGGRLYLKADAHSLDTFVAAGCEAFAFVSAGRTIATHYFSAPDEALESPQAMRPWARLALDAALRASAAKARARPAARKAKPRSGASSKAPTTS